jgi:hypothetical protein
MTLSEGSRPETVVRGEEGLVELYYFYGNTISQKKYPTRGYFFLSFYFISQI